MNAAGELVLSQVDRGAAEEPDRRLVEAAARGDVAAFDCLVERHWAKVASVAGRFLGDSNEVEDAAQEAFIQAYRHLKTFRGDASVRTWLIRIVANVCRSRRRSFWGRRVELRETPLEAMPVAEGRFSELEQALTAHQVAEALQRLPERQRLPLILHFYEELSGPEIAAALGWRESTVWSRIYAGYRTLRRQLQSTQER